MGCYEIFPYPGKADFKHMCEVDQINV